MRSLTDCNPRPSKILAPLAEVFIGRRPSRLLECREGWPRCNDGQPRQRYQTSGDQKRDFRESKGKRRVRSDVAKRRSHGFRIESQSENCRNIQTNRCEDIKPPIRRRCLRNSWEGLRWFLPLQAVSLLSKVGTVALSVARLPDGKAVALDTGEEDTITPELGQQYESFIVCRQAFNLENKTYN